MSNQVKELPQVDEWKQLTEQGNEAYEQKKLAETELKFVAALRIAEKWAAQENLAELSAQEQNEVHGHLAKSLNNMAALYHSQGKYTMAEDLYKRCLEVKKKLYGEDHLEVAINLHNLAALYSAKRRWQEAEELYKKSLYIKEQVLGEDSLELVLLLKNYALMLRRSNRDQDAEPIEERAAKISSLKQ